jgi:hypothetical protein
MRRALLRPHVSGPNRFSLATPPARSGVLHDGEKITIRVAEPDDLRAEAHPGVHGGLHGGHRGDEQIASPDVVDQAPLRPALRRVPRAIFTSIKCTLPP